MQLDLLMCRKGTTVYKKVAHPLRTDHSQIGDVASSCTWCVALPANYTSANVESSFKGGHHLILHNGSELTVFPLAHADLFGVLKDGQSPPSLPTNTLIMSVLALDSSRFAGLMGMCPTQRPVRMAVCYLYLNGQRSSRAFLPLSCGSWADNDLSYRVPEEVGNLHFCAECCVAFLGCTVSTALSWPQGLVLSPTCTRMRKIQTRCFW